jgi:hypothetical protein
MQSKLIRTLLAAPGQAFPVASLLRPLVTVDQARSADNREPGLDTVERFRGVPTMNAQMKRELTARLEELSVDRTAANDRGEDEAIARVEDETEAIRIRCCDRPIGLRRVV